MKLISTLTGTFIGIAAIGLLVVACGTGKSSDRIPTVAIATLMPHPALDALQDSLIKEMTSQGYEEGRNIKYVRRNANGQAQLATSIVDEMTTQKPDAIVAITTPMAQAAARVGSIPLVFAAVTDPVGAGLVKTLDQPPPLVTGTSDAWPYQAQLQLIREITPGVKRLGFIFNPGEAPAAYGLGELKRLVGPMGFELVEGAVSSTNEVSAVAEQIASHSDALFVGSDNTAISGVAGALQVAAAHRLPLYVGDSGTVQRGGVAAVSVGYSALGRETARLLIRVLHGERGIPVVSASGDEVYVNTKAAELTGVKIAPAVLQRATRVFSSIEN